MSKPAAEKPAASPPPSCAASAAGPAAPPEAAGAQRARSAETGSKRHSRKPCVFTAAATTAVSAPRNPGNFSCDGAATLVGQVGEAAADPERSQVVRDSRVGGGAEMGGENGGTTSLKRWR